MNVYVLNSTPLTFGEWEYKKLSIQEAKNLLGENKFLSAIGHEGTARFLTRLTGISIPVNRTKITMAVGDIAIVFKLSVRLPEGVVLTEREVETTPYELGLLRRVA